MRSGRRRETPTMGVVVAVPDRRQLDLPPRSLVLSPNARPAWAPAGKGAAAPQVCFAQIQRPVRGLGRTFGLHSLRRSESAVVARFGGAAQAGLARAGSREPGEKAGFGCRRLPGTMDMPDV